MRGALCLLVAAGVGLSIAAKQDVKDAAAILADARKAIGGKRLDALQGVSLEGTVQRNVGDRQLKATTEIHLELPDKYSRVDTMAPPLSGGTSMGFNGDQPLQHAGGPGGAGALIVRMGNGPMGPPPAGPKLPPDEQEKADRAFVRGLHADVCRMMLGWFATALPSTNAQFSYAGQAESPDGKAYVLDVKNADGFAARLFIDESSHLPLMVTYKAPKPRVITRTAGPGTKASQAAPGDAADAPPEMADFTLYFDGWQDAGGIRFPHSLRRAMDGTTTEEWDITSVKINPKVDPKTFAVQY